MWECGDFCGGGVREFLARFGEVAEREGFLREKFGETEAGELVVWEKCGGVGSEVVYLSAGMHGDEPAGPLAMLRLLEECVVGGGGRTWRLLPVLNPVGLSRGTRENGDGVDLNRDYCVCVTNEVRSHRGWLERVGAPDLFLSLHEDWESGGFYFYEIGDGLERVARARELLLAAEPHVGVERELWIDGHEVRERGWIFHGREPDLPEGWPEAIFLAKMGCDLSLTFETPSSQSLERRVAAHVAVVRCALGLVMG